MAKPTFKHSPATIQKIRTRLLYIRMMIEKDGSYTTGSIGAQSRRARMRVRAEGRTITRLGNPNGAAHLAGRGNKASVQAQKDKADAFALRLAPILDDIRATWKEKGSGPPSFREVVQELMLRNVATYRGTIWQWQPSTIRRLVERIARLRDS
jgi:hypothetical protein